jgi:uncharacterized protein (TIGR03435 family)
MRMFLPLTAVLLCGIGSINKSADQQTDLHTAPLTFEVASIKPALLGCIGHQPFGPNSLTTCGALRHLIMLAYGVEDYQVIGGLPWVHSDYYDVIAKTANRSSPHEMKIMLQVLLVERFHLRLTRETKMMSGYALSVEKGSRKLPPQNTTAPPDSTGTVQMGDGEFWARGATMKTLAQSLRIELERPVVDETGLDGHYDFKLRFEGQDRELSGSIFTALHEIGLRLDARKVPKEILAIQTADRPSEI